MNKHTFLRRPTAVLAAVLLVGILTVTAFAYGGRIVEHVYTLMSGGTVEQVIDETGDAYVCGSVDTTVSLVELREDGHVYLTAGEEEVDITGQFSYTEPYIHEYTDEDGLRHVFVVGGKTDAIGWSEFIWGEDGLPAGGSSQFGTPNGRDDAPWLDAAMETLGLPW